MNTTVTLSLPAEQLLLMENLTALQQQLVNFQIGGAWLTEKEAAQRLKVKECDIRTWRLEGWLRFYQVDDQIRYKTEDLDQDFEDQARLSAQSRENKKVETENVYLNSAQNAGDSIAREAFLGKRKSTGISAAQLKANSRKQA